MKESMFIKPLVYPECIFDEFPLGYLIRLVEANCYGKMSWLINKNYEKTETKTSHFIYDNLITEDWTGFKTNSNYHQYRNLGRRLFMMARYRYCPLCLQESTYLKTVWQLKPSVICSKHKVWLRDCCDACQKPLTKFSSMISRCECGELLSLQPVMPAAREMIKLQKFIEGTQSIDNITFSTLEEKLNFLLFFNKWIKYREPFRGTYTCENARNTMEDVGEALFYGRVGFMNFLIRLHSLEVMKKTNYFKIFHCRFYEEFTSPEFEPIKEMIESFVNEHWRKPLTKRNRHFSEDTISNHPWIPFGVASKNYDLPKSLLKRAINEGIVRFQIDIKERISATYVYRPDIEERLFRIKDYITSKEARLILGLTKLQFSKLREKNIFSTAISPEASGLATWTFSRDEIQSFCTKATLGLPCIGGDMWSFSEIMKFFGGQIDDLLTTFWEAIKNGDIKPVSVNKNKAGVASLMFLKKDFLMWLELRKKNEEYMSIPTLAKVLGVNQQFAYELINHGYIKTIEKDMDRTRWITKDLLREFNKTYVLLSKMTKVVDLNSRLLKNYLASRGIYPVDSRKGESLRQKLYLVEDLINIQILSEYINLER